MGCLQEVHEVGQVEVVAAVEVDVLGEDWAVLDYAAETQWVLLEEVGYHEDLGAAEKSVGEAHFVHLQIVSVVDERLEIWGQDEWAC